MKALVIDRQDVAFNLQLIKQRADGAQIIANLSANAQGMGLIETARLLRGEGIGSFAVSETEAVALLRSEGFEEENILMLRSTLDPEEIKKLVENRAILTVGSHEAAAAINGIAEGLGTVAEVHIKIDMGLGHYGFRPNEVDKILSIYNYMSNLAISGIYMRFSDALKKEKQVREELEGFRAVIAKINETGFETGIAHAADSVALFKYDFCNLDAVCPGSALIGRLPGKENFGLKKVGYIEAGLEEVKWHPAGGKIGAGGGGKIKKPLKTAVVPVGWYNGVGQSPDCSGLSLKGPFSRLGAVLGGQLKQNRPLVKVGSGKARIMGGIGMNFMVINVTSTDSQNGDKVRIDVDPRLVKGLEIVYR